MAYIYALAQRAGQPVDELPLTSVEANHKIQKLKAIIARHGRTDKKVKFVDPDALPPAKETKICVDCGDSMPLKRPFERCPGCERKRRSMV